MIQTANIPITIRRSDTSTHRFTLTDVNELTGERFPINISQWTFLGQAKRSESNNWFTFPIIKRDELNGVIEFSITKADGETLLPLGSNQSDSANYEIQATIGSGLNAKTATFVSGTFRVVADLVEGGRTLAAPDSGDLRFRAHAMSILPKEEMPYQEETKFVKPKRV